MNQKEAWEKLRTALYTAEKDGPLCECCGLPKKVAEKAQHFQGFTDETWAIFHDPNEDPEEQA